MGLSRRIEGPAGVSVRNLITRVVLPSGSGAGLLHSLRLMVSKLGAALVRPGSAKEMLTITKVEKSTTSSLNTSMPVKHPSINTGITTTNNTGITPLTQRSKLYDQQRRARVGFGIKSRPAPTHPPLTVTCVTSQLTSPVVTACVSNELQSGSLVSNNISTTNNVAEITALNTKIVLCEPMFSYLESESDEDSELKAMRTRHDPLEIERYQQRCFLLIDVVF